MQIDKADEQQIELLYELNMDASKYEIVTD